MRNELLRMLSRTTDGCFPHRVIGGCFPKPPLRRGCFPAPGRNRSALSKQGKRSIERVRSRKKRLI